MTTIDIIKNIENNFSKVYVHFQDFQRNNNYRAYWDKCIEAAGDRKLLSHIIFCNDIFSIPPVKTFLTYYKEYFISLSDKPKAELDVFVKKSIGAFWGMVFKSVLGYQEQKSVSVSMYDFFIVKTASCFISPKEKFVLE